MRFPSSRAHEFIENKSGKSGLIGEGSPDLGGAGSNKDSPTFRRPREVRTKSHANITHLFIFQVSIFGGRGPMSGDPSLAT